MTRISENSVVIFKKLQGVLNQRANTDDAVSFLNGAS